MAGLRVFVYGTLMAEEVVKALLADRTTKYTAAAELKGYHRYMYMYCSYTANDYLIHVFANDVEVSPRERTFAH